VVDVDCLTGHFKDIFCGPAMISSSSDIVADSVIVYQPATFQHFIANPTLFGQDFTATLVLPPFNFVNQFLYTSHFN
jgi:hypothetical protein